MPQPSQPRRSRDRPRTRLTCEHSGASALLHRAFDAARTSARSRPWRQLEASRCAELSGRWQGSSISFALEERRHTQSCQQRGRPPTASTGHHLGVSAHTHRERPVRLGAHRHAGFAPARPRNTTTVSLRAKRVAQKDTRLLRWATLYTGGSDSPEAQLRPPDPAGEPPVRPARSGVLEPRGKGGSICNDPARASEPLSAFPCHHPAGGAAGALVGRPRQQSRSGEHQGGNHETSASPAGHDRCGAAPL